MPPHKGVNIIYLNWCGRAGTHLSHRTLPIRRITRTVTFCNKLSTTEHIYVKVRTQLPPTFFSATKVKVFWQSVWLGLQRNNNPNTLSIWRKAFTWLFLVVKCNKIHNTNILQILWKFQQKMLYLKVHYKLIYEI